MGSPLGVVVGTGRMAGGFVAPLLHDAGWQTVMVGRDDEVVESIREQGAVWLHTGGSARAGRRRIGHVSAIHIGSAAVSTAVRRADLLATAVGPGALASVGQMLGHLLVERFARGGRAVNIVTFENHRRAPELLTSGLLAAEPSLAGEFGHRLGVGGAVAWRAIASRTVRDGEVTYDADDDDECSVGLLPLLDGVPPRDGSVPGVDLVRSFDARMVEKLWVFNAGHAAAAYLGWLAGCSTLAEALALPPIRQPVRGVVEEAGVAFRARLERRPLDDHLPPRPASAIMARYADPALGDTVTRVGREPRRKLAADDRLVAPAMVCLGSRVWPVGLATAIAAALAYAEPADPQAVDLRAELRLLGPAETLATVSGLHPCDELSGLVCRRFESLRLPLVAGRDRRIRPRGDADVLATSPSIAHVG
jgi:mannitol-1-phosphate 5-dehydrogenase